MQRLFFNRPYVRTRIKSETEDGYLDVSGWRSDHGVQLSLESAHDRRVLQKLTESEAKVNIWNAEIQTRLCYNPKETGYVVRKKYINSRSVKNCPPQDQKIVGSNHARV
jgi:hypothetical protein